MQKVAGAAELIAQHSSWRERLAPLRRAPRSAWVRFARAAFAPVPEPSAPVECEIVARDRYEDGLAALAGWLDRPTPPLRHERRGLEHFVEYHRTTTGAIGISDLLFLHAFVSVVAPERVVEIGTLSGFSAAVIADAVAEQQSPGADSVIVDTLDLSERCLTDKTKPVGFEIPQLVPHLSDRIRVHPGKDARHVEVIARLKELELVFIDADHQHPRPTLDLLRVAPFVTPGGWIVVHDVELGSMGERLRAAGAALDYGAPFGAQWLFEAWPWQKISGGNIGALRLPSRLPDLVPFALATLRIPSELKPTAARQTQEAFLTTASRLR